MNRHPPTRTVLFTLSAMAAMPDIPPIMLAEEPPPWAPKRHGKPFSGGRGTKASKANSGRYVQTKHGCYKKRKKRK